MESQLLSLLPQLTSASGPDRNSAELMLTQQLLPERPREVLEGLLKIASHKDVQEPTRIQALVLLRRFAFRPLTPSDPTNPSPTYSPKEAWDELSIPAQNGILSGLLGLLGETGETGGMREGERRAVADTIGEMGKQSLIRKHPWTDLPQALLQAASHPSYGIRESSYRIYSSVPQSLDPPFASPPSVVSFLVRGLTDSSSPGVRLAALEAGVAWVRSDESLEGVEEVVKAMLSVLPPLVEERKEERLLKALESLVEMVSLPRGARACLPVSREIVSFISNFVRPAPSSSSSEAFDDDVRQTGLELLIALGENAGEAMLDAPDKGRAFLQGVLPLVFAMMTEIEDDPGWYKVEKTTSEEEDDETYIVSEQGLDRLAQVFGSPEGSPFPGVCFELVAPMAEDGERWQVRHAALSAIGAVAEGCAERLLDQTAALNGLIEKGLDDRHPRVKFAAVYAVAQLCSSLEGIYQDNNAGSTLSRLINVMASREPRLQAFAATALINFSENCSPDLLSPFLEPLFRTLLRLLEGGIRFVQEAAIGALANIIDASDEACAPHYPGLMPILLTILETPLDERYRELVGKTMDCAALLAAAAGPEVFAPDAERLAKDIMNAKATVIDDADPVATAVVTAFTLLAKAMGPDRFMPYLDFLLPILFEGANLKPDISISGTLDSEHEYDEDWEQIELGGQVFGIRTAVLEEKATAVEMLCILCDTLGSRLLPQYPKIIHTILPLLKFYFSEDVREAAAALLPTILKGSKEANLPRDQLVNIANSFSTSIIDTLSAEANPAFSALLLLAWSQIYEELPHGVSSEQVSQLLTICESLLQQISVREKVRADISARLHVGADDELDLEEAEDADQLTLQYMARVLRFVIANQKERFDLAPFRGCFQAWIREQPGKETSKMARRWALVVAGALVQSLGPASAAEVAPFSEDIVKGVASDELEIRYSSAFVVGSCAAFAAPAYVDLINAAVGPLVKGFARGVGTDIAKLARENCVSAIAKIIRNQTEGVRIDVEAILPSWVAALPVELDTEEIEPAYGLLLELIARGHLTVSPSDPATASHTATVLAVPLGSKSLPHAFRAPLATGLRSYLHHIPGEAQRNEIWAKLPEAAKKALEGQ